MKAFMDSHLLNKDDLCSKILLITGNKIILLSVIQVLLLLAVLVWSVITGQYPLTLKSLLSGDTMSIMVFKRLRLPRAYGCYRWFWAFNIRLYISAYI